MDIFEAFIILTPIQSFHFFAWNLWLIIMTSSISSLAQVTKNWKCYFFRSLMNEIKIQCSHGVSGMKIRGTLCSIFHRTLSEVRKFPWSQNGICYCFLSLEMKNNQTFAEMSQNIICEGTVSFLFWLSVDNTWLSLFLSPFHISRKNKRKWVIPRIRKTLEREKLWPLTIKSNLQEFGQNPNARFWLVEILKAPKCLVQGQIRVFKACEVDFEGFWPITKRLKSHMRQNHMRNLRLQHPSPTSM